MQLLNRIASPPLFGKITEEMIRPEDVMSDEDYLDLILKNWGKNVVFQLRSNMDFVDPKFKDNRHALDTIRELQTTLDRYFSPTNLITSEGNTLGGSSSSELETQNQYIRGIHRWLEEQFEAILNHYLDVNQYEGYAVRITIPEPSIDRSELEMKQAQVGFSTRALTLDERREHLGARAADDEIRAELEREFASMPLPGAGPGPGFFGQEGTALLTPHAITLLGPEKRPGEAPGEKKAEAQIAEEIRRHTDEMMDRVLGALRKDETIVPPPEKAAWIRLKEMFEPPEAGDAPKAVMDILRKVYQSCREDNPGEVPEHKEKCAKIAWAAVKDAGWEQDADGEWKKVRKAKKAVP